MNWWNWLFHSVKRVYCWQLECDAFKSWCENCKQFPILVYRRRDILRYLYLGHSLMIWLPVSITSITLFISVLLKFRRAWLVSLEGMSQKWMVPLQPFFNRALPSVHRNSDFSCLKKCSIHSSCLRSDHSNSSSNQISAFIWSLCMISSLAVIISYRGFRHKGAYLDADLSS